MATVALGVALIFARPVLIPFVLALFIGIMVSPIFDYLVIKLKFPGILSALVTMCVCIIILSGLFLVVINAVEAVISTVGQSGQTASQIEEDNTPDRNFDSVVEQYTKSFSDFVNKTSERLKKWNINVDVPALTSDLQKSIPNLAKGMFGKFFNFVTSALLVIIFVLFIIVGRNPRQKKPQVYHEIETEIRRYLLIKTVLSLATGLFVWLTLGLLGLHLAGIFGMLAFLLNFIPSIGSIIATFLPLPIAVAQFDKTWLIVLAILLPGAVQITIGNIIEPKLMGARMKLHPATVLLALSFWGLLWGGVGMVLAVPITAVMRIILSRFETLKPVALLLSGKLPQFGEDK
jgi:AI-2 transport protein TqsA